MAHVYCRPLPAPIWKNPVATEPSSPVGHTSRSLNFPPEPPTRDCVQPLERPTHRHANERQRRKTSDTAASAGGRILPLLGEELLERCRAVARRLQEALDSADRDRTAIGSSATKDQV